MSHQHREQADTVVIFCKSRNFLQETAETLGSHVSFINFIFGVELHQMDDVSNMIWFASNNYTEILYMAGHTGDAVQIIRLLHNLCVWGIGTSIRDVYLNTCSSKPVNSESLSQSSSPSGIVFPWEANEDEKIKLGIAKNQFLTLDDMLETAKDDIFKIHLCQQDIVEDVYVKMARFLPMDECGLGFSPTKSELLLYNHKGQLSEKLQAAFGDI